MIILEKGERADPLWGMDTEIITDEMIEALEQGKRLYLSVNDEYAVVIKKDGKRKTDKPEATDTDTISRQDAIDAIYALQKDGCIALLDCAVDEVKNLPSAPQRTGSWRHYERCLTCSECGTDYYDDIMDYCGDDVPKFCPNYGAKMMDDEND